MKIPSLFRFAFGILALLIWLSVGAIIAGTILGTLAMRTRSIWGGVLIHCAVAFTMDGMALHHCPPAASHLPCEG